MGAVTRRTGGVVSLNSAWAQKRRRGRSAQRCLRSLVHRRKTTLGRAQTGDEQARVSDRAADIRYRVGGLLWAK